MPKGNADFEAGFDAGLNDEPDVGGNADFTAGYREGVEVRKVIPKENSTTGGCGLRIFLWLAGLVLSFFCSGYLVAGPFDGVWLYIIATVIVLFVGKGGRSSGKRG